MNIGVDIGGTKCRVGVVENDRVLRKKEIKHRKVISSEELIKNIVSMISELTDEKPEGVGIGLPGILSRDRTIWIKVPNMIPQERNIKFADSVAQKVGARAVMENDGNAFALGELHYGLGEKYDNLIMITLGTGIGGGIIMDRRLIIGRQGAGEIGHMTIAENGVQCACGHQGCWEEYVSVKSLRRLSRQYFGREMTSHDLMRLAEGGDPNALRVFSEMGRYLGVGMKNIANIFDPDVIVISGGLSHTFKFMIDEARNVMKDSWLSTRIEISRVPDIEILGPESLLHH